MGKVEAGNVATQVKYVEAQCQPRNMRALDSDIFLTQS